MATLLPEQLKAQVLDWRERWGGQRVFAVRTDDSYDGNPELNCDGLSLEIAECRSDLEARERLLGLDAKDSRGLLLLVRANQSSIGEDVMARFAGRQLQTLDQRKILGRIYQASSVDPRISSEDVLLDALVAAASSGNTRMAPGGVLDLDFAWSVLLKRPELMNQRPDLVEILRWSLDESKWATVAALDEELVSPFFDWVGERAGNVAKCLKVLLQTNQVNLYLPLGLVAGDLLDESLARDEGAIKAQGRLENYLNGESLKLSDASVWKAAARETLTNASAEALERIAGEVDAILEVIRANDIASAFSFSKQGFKERWITFADDIDRLAKRKWETGSRAVYNSLSQVSEHALARLHESRIKRAGMAARLAAYEAQLDGGASHIGLKSKIAHFATSDSFVDRARFSLSWGDSLPEVTKAYGRLCKRVAKLRTDSQMQIGDKLCQWHADNETKGDGFLPIENVVSECVAPLADQAPVLLLVMDGMNFPAFHQLSDSMVDSGWAPFVEEGQEHPTAVLSVLPSMTDVSRWALFSGKIAKGKRKGEALAFREHPALADLRGRGKPLLYVKGDLGSADSAALSSEVRDKIAGTDHRVIAVVINAIDDQLKTGGQLSVDWTVPGIGILPAILEAASDGGRLIVMTSDHGHIPEMENTKPMEQASPGEARYRQGSVSDANEREFTGTRVEAATGGTSVILPITETIRYGQKAGGYHGGACDLEALVPLTVFSAPNAEIDGWDAVDLSRPSWWNWKTNLLTAGAQPVAKPKPRPKKKKVETVDDLPLFASEDTAAQRGDCPWLASFLASEVYAEQIQLLGRAAPKEDHIEKVLVALHSADGQLLLSVLASAIGEPAFRMKGILSRVTRFMNVDGYEVIENDQASETVRLNRKLLSTQFHISA